MSTTQGTKRLGGRGRGREGARIGPFRKSGSKKRIGSSSSVNRYSDYADHDEVVSQHKDESPTQEAAKAMPLPTSQELDLSQAAPLSIGKLNARNFLASSAPALYLPLTHPPRPHYSPQTA